MPKQAFVIDKFHGGLNDSANPRDVENEELTLAKGITVDSLGAVKPSGEFVPTDTAALEQTSQFAETFEKLATSPTDITNEIVPGYGYFNFSHDQKYGNYGNIYDISIADDQPENTKVLHYADQNNAPLGFPNLGEKAYVSWYASKYINIDHVWPSDDTLSGSQDTSIKGASFKNVPNFGFIQDHLVEEGTMSFRGQISIVGMCNWKDLTSLADEDTSSIDEIFGAYGPTTWINGISDDTVIFTCAQAHNVYENVGFLTCHPNQLATYWSNQVLAGNYLDGQWDFHDNFIVKINSGAGDWQTIEDYRLNGSGMNPGTYVENHNVFFRIDPWRFGLAGLKIDLSTIPQSDDPFVNNDVWFNIEIAGGHGDSRMINDYNNQYAVETQGFYPTLHTNMRLILANFTGDAMIPDGASSASIALDGEHYKMFIDAHNPSNLNQGIVNIWAEENKTWVTDERIDISEPNISDPNDLRHQGSIKTCYTYVNGNVFINDSNYSNFRSIDNGVPLIYGYFKSSPSYGSMWSQGQTVMHTGSNPFGNVSNPKQNDVLIPMSYAGWYAHKQELPAPRSVHEIQALWVNWEAQENSTSTNVKKYVLPEKTFFINPINAGIVEGYEFYGTAQEDWDFEKGGIKIDTLFLGGAGDWHFKNNPSNGLYFYVCYRFEDGIEGPLHEFGWKNAEAWGHSENATENMFASLWIDIEIPTHDMIYDERTTGFSIYYTTKESSSADRFLLVECDMEKGYRPAGNSSYTSWALHERNPLSIDPDEIHPVTPDYGRVAWKDAFQILRATFEIKEMPKAETFDIRNGYRHDEELCVNWKCSTICNRRLYIGNVFVNNQHYNDSMIKSPSNKFPILPLSRRDDVVQQDGDSIVQLESFGDTILQFKENILYIIDVSGQSSFLEASYKYKGVHHPEAVVKTDYGVAWVNEFGVYLYDGEIHDLIETQEGEESENKVRRLISPDSWADFFDSDEYNTVISYSPIDKQLIILNTCGENDFSSTNLAVGSDSFVYDIITESWTRNTAIFNQNIRKITNMQVNRFGGVECIGEDSSGTNNAYVYSRQPLSSKDVEFVTKDFDFGDPGVTKKIYKVIITYTGGTSQDINLQYRINGTGDWSDALGGFDNDLDDTTGSQVVTEFKPSGTVSLNSLNSFQLRFQGVAATTFVLNDLTIVYRKKNVK